MKISIEFEGLSQEEMMHLQQKILRCITIEYPDKILDTTFIEDGITEKILGVEFEEM